MTTVPLRTLFKVAHRLCKFIKLNFIHEMVVGNAVILASAIALCMVKSTITKLGI